MVLGMLRREDREIPGEVILFIENQLKPAGGKY